MSIRGMDTDRSVNQIVVFTRLEQTPWRYSPLPIQAIQYNKIQRIFTAIKISSISPKVVGEGKYFQIEATVV